MDTDVASMVAFRKKGYEPFASLLEGHALFISFVTVGEMYYGARKGNWGTTKVSNLERIIENYTIIPGTYEIAQSYGHIKKAFFDQVEENDMWIAATALVYNLPIATNNLRHFNPMSDRFEFGIVHPNQ